MISKEELFADIITNKITLSIDCLDKIGAHFIFVKEYGVDKSVFMFKNDLTRLYHTLLSTHYIECINLKYNNDKDKYKTLNYKLHKFLSYHKTPQYNILKQSEMVEFKDFYFRLDQYEFYYKDKDGFTINMAPINLLVLVVDNENYYLPADRENFLIRYLCKGEEI